jgi:predicted ATPase
MLERVRIHNYGPFDDVDVTLRPLTWLIGKNHTGKEAFVHAVRVLAESVASWPSCNHFREDGVLEGALEDGRRVRERVANLGSCEGGSGNGKLHVVRVSTDRNGGGWKADGSQPRAFQLFASHLPENGEHFAELPAIARRLTEMRCAGNVLVVTYSPLLLDHANLDRDQILVFRNGEDKKCKVTPIDAQRVRAYLDGTMIENALGDMWVAEGEEGMV